MASKPPCFCSLQLNEYSEEPLDSCDTGLIEEDGSDAQTVGDHLCKRAYDLAVVDKAPYTNDVRRVSGYPKPTSPCPHLAVGTDYM